MKNTYHTITIDSEHSIEFGKAPWDNSVDTIRRRKNNSGGGYDPFSSSEIPINEGFLDISRLVCECLKMDLIPRGDMTCLFNELTASAARQGITLP